MTQILIDTSAWIEFFNNSKSDISKQVSNLITNGSIIYLCPIVFQEILQGIKSDKDFENIKKILYTFPMLNDNPLIVAEKAISIYRDTRKNGITIRKSNDCTIAAYAILNNLPLLHCDKDFTMMQKIFTELKLI